MAEALINDLMHGQYRAWSAGSHPAGYVHPKSIETLTRYGIDPGRPRSKSWHEFAEESFDLMITVCDQAAGESCPLFPGTPKKLHWGMPDPAKVIGSEAEIDAAFDKTFFLLRERVEDLQYRSDAASTERDGTAHEKLSVDRSSGTVARSTL